jgi:hypothetical protein
MYAAFNAMANRPKHRTIRAGLDARPQSVGWPALKDRAGRDPSHHTPPPRKSRLSGCTAQIPAARRVAQHPAPAKLSTVVTRERVLAVVGLLEISDFGLTAPAARGEGRSCPRPSAASVARPAATRAALRPGPARPAPESLCVTCHLARLCQEIPAKTTCRPSEVKRVAGAVVDKLSGFGRSRSVDFKGGAPTTGL